ncbi:MAG: antibiotic biosynthesis monooxygenase [Thiogranum sp.]|nr:antibiotic biosynthesis monooxygenase [Thiogranum sp.]
MYVTLVHVHVMPEHNSEFIAATRDNHRASIDEPGNLRFDVLQSPEDPNYFILYEAYKSKQDAAAHKETDHYRRWRDSVAGWMAQPRQGVPFTGLYPEANK